MPKDTEEELQRLEQWLLSEEEDEEEEAPQEQEAPAPLSTYGAGCKVYNTDHTDEDLEQFSQEVYTAKKDSLTGLALIFILLCAGILCVLAYWLLRWKGVIG